MMQTSEAARPFGIYLHWPFCAAKCPYCDFNSHVRHRPIDEQRFAAAFAREMAAIRFRSGPRRVSSIFIGGGTPSLMQPQTIATILDEIAALWEIADNVEITMEANPSSVEAARFHGYRAAGVNRLSLGVQALDDGELKRLGRLHNKHEALIAIDLARTIFPRLSFDLIYARPDQSLKAWKQELEEALDLAADHLSLYQLTIERGTYFHKLYAAGRLKLPADETAAALYALTQEITAARGLPAYEISNHAVPGGESRHNLLYWRGQDYVGFGAGAHGRFYEQGAKKGIRTVTITEKMPERWLALVEKNGTGIIEEEHLSRAQQADELLLMGLRLDEGLDIGHYESLARRALPGQKLARLQEQNLVEMCGNNCLRATARGRIVLDTIITDLAI